MYTKLVSKQQTKECHRTTKKKKKKKNVTVFVQKVLIMGVFGSVTVFVQKMLIVGLFGLKKHGFYIVLLILYKKCLLWGYLV